MDILARIEESLESVVARSAAAGAPPKLAEAIHYAVFPGGGRVRPRLCLAVAMSCGEDQPTLTNAAASAIELMHCASLVHDDLPCFDDADVRRGKPSVHKAFGEPLALLAGDAMIVMAFETLSRACQEMPARAASLNLALAQAVGLPGGIIAGQGWESEEKLDLAAYHRAKTGSLFIAASHMGAAAAGADPAQWRALGARLGDAYQLADDLRDIALSTEELGKPAGQDAAHERPSAAKDLGIEATLEKLDKMIGAAVDSIPECPGADLLTQLVQGEAKRLVPKKLALRAA